MVGSLDEGPPSGLGQVECSEFESVKYYSEYSLISVLRVGENSVLVMIDPGGHDANFNSIFKKRFI